MIYLINDCGSILHLNTETNWAITWHTERTESLPSFRMRTEAVIEVATDTFSFQLCTLWFDFNKEDEPEKQRETIKRVCLAKIDLVFTRIFNHLGRYPDKPLVLDVTDILLLKEEDEE